MRRIVLLLACAALAVAGCSTPGPPKITFYADGDSVRAAPLRYCDALLRECEQSGSKAALTVREGEPVQISVPGDVARTPWLVNVQYLTESGQPQLEQEVFTSGDQHAFTVNAGGPAAQLVVVEVQQIGAAYAVDEQGQPILDPAGNPQLVARGIWSLQITPA